MNVRLQEDYPLTGDITSFEAYMFVTTNKFIGEHTNIPHENFYVCHGDDTDNYILDDLVSRKDALHNLNVYMTQKLGHFPKAEDLGCFIAYLEAGTPEEDDDSTYFLAYNYFAELVNAFCSVSSRVVGFVPHFHQGNNCPHVHFLYQKEKGEDSILQKYLTVMMDNQDEQPKSITKQTNENEDN